MPIEVIQPELSAYRVVKQNTGYAKLWPENFLTYDAAEQAATGSVIIDGVPCIIMRHVAKIQKG